MPIYVQLKIKIIKCTAISPRVKMYVHEGNIIISTYWSIQGKIWRKKIYIYTISNRNYLPTCYYLNKFQIELHLKDLVSTFSISFIFHFLPKQEFAITHVLNFTTHYSAYLISPCQLGNFILVSPSIKWPK